MCGGGKRHVLLRVDAAAGLRVVRLVLKGEHVVQIVRPAEGERFADGLVSILVRAQGLFFPEDVAYLDLDISVSSPAREQAEASVAACCRGV